MTDGWGVAWYTQEALEKGFSRRMGYEGGGGVATGKCYLAGNVEGLRAFDPFSGFHPRTLALGQNKARNVFSTLKIRG